MSPVAHAVQLSVGLVTIALVCQATASMVRTRSLPPNGLVGIKTRATRASPEAWWAGHDAARPVLLTTAVMCAATVVTLVATGGLLRSHGSGDTVVLVLGLGCYVVVVALMVYATVVANRPARLAAPPPDD
jgi:peptidoglycan biosynthesis protein MviN/MurJ (putative lipid II flippase)